MANEIVHAFDKGSTLYGRIFNSTGQVWNTAGTPAFENWNDANVTDYDIALTDKTSGQYIGSYPTTAAGQYKVNVYKQAGASPAITDTVVGTGDINWTGSAESVIEVDMDAIIAKLPTNYIMGSSVQSDKDDEIDAIKAKTDKIINVPGTVFIG